MKGNCPTDVAKLDDNYIGEFVDRDMPIWVEEGADQEAKYYEVIRRIEEYTKKVKSYKQVKVYCKGKFPIEKITVVPTYDRERKAEQI